MRLTTCTHGEHADQILEIFNEAIIDATNGTSIAMHEKLGFTHAGTIRQAGFKFGRWLDLVFYQKLLPTPAAPVDG